MTTLSPVRQRLLALRPSVWWQKLTPPWKLEEQYVAAPSTALFNAIRRRLTLWYTAVLATILVLLSLLLYFGTQTTIDRQSQGRAVAASQALTSNWQRLGVSPCQRIEHGSFGSGGGGTPASPLSPNSFGYRQGPYIASCYTATGQPDGADGVANAIPAFLSANLAERALSSPAGTASDNVDGGASFGSLERLAHVVRNLQTGQVIGVVQVGMATSGQQRVLGTLAVVLLLVDALGIAVAGVAGMTLSRRALTPARLAFERQQAFIADASHELRTPLTLMRADAELLLRGRERMDEEDALLLEDIVDEVERMSQLTTSLLTLARLDTQLTPAERGPVELSDVCEEIARRVQSFAASHEVQVQVAPGQQNGGLVLGERHLIAQALLILVDNAIKYNRPGGAVHITVARREQQMIVQVQDTGIGIPPDHLARLGERFYRIDKARSREMGGNGLGLSIARAIAHQHGGTLTFESEQGIGTTATFALPAA